MTKNCKICGKEFIPRHNQQRFCSKECSHESTHLSKRKYDKTHCTPRKLAVKICPNCGKEFQPVQNAQKYCSENCSEISDKEKSRQSARARRAKKRKLKLPKNCKICGREFTPRGNHQFCCSKECSRKNNTKNDNARRAKNRNWLLSKNCIICGREFMPRRHSQICCCKECGRIRKNKITAAAQKRPTVTKICPVCGKEFETNNSIKKYCSDKCRDSNENAARRKLPAEKKKTGKKPLATNSTPKLKKICVNCHKEFEVTSPNQKTCSPECSQERKKNIQAAHNLTATLNKTSIKKKALNKTSTREKKPPKNQAATITSDKVSTAFELNDAQRAQRDRLKEILLQRREQRELATQAEMYEAEFAEMCRAEHLW